MEHRAASLKVVFAGFQYMMKSSLLLGASSLDLFVVLLGGATALMPIFAHEVLHQGPRGLGMLRAAPAAGALLMSLTMARFPFRRHAGLRLFVCVAIFGAATVVFGLSHNLWLSLAALALGGGADTISVIIRGSLLQLGTPPEMRGRVSAVNSLFIGASNELGDFESGLTAQWWGALLSWGAWGHWWLPRYGPGCFPASAMPTNSPPRLSGECNPARSRQPPKLLDSADSKPKRNRVAAPRIKEQPPENPSKEDQLRRYIQETCLEYRQGCGMS
jgi:MFS family permease